VPSSTVMNVSGHGISTSEVESALVDHHGAAEAVVVSASEATGQVIVAFVILREGAENTGDVLIAELKAQVSTDISPPPIPD
jgi:acetyl-CoA synthetase